MRAEARTFTADELAIGLTTEYDREITEADVRAFAENSGDGNPLHVDAEYARQSNYQGRIAHGAFQVGLASALLGMHLPGRNVLLGSINARFPAPLYYPSRVNVRGEIASWNRRNLSGQLKVVVRGATTRVATAEIAMGFTLHEARTPHEDRAKATAESTPDTSRDLVDRKVILVTGGSGGLGAAITADLARDYQVISASYRQPLDDRLKAIPGVRELRADLTSAGWPEAVVAALGDQRLFGIVHAAWPGVPKGGLLEIQEDVLELQLAFGTSYTIRLARLLAAHADPEVGGRLVALGSIFGVRKPTITLAAYSLAKAALEMTIGLLAPEMARKQITVNAICPSFVPTGMNKQADDRQLRVATARVPLGRLCGPEDVAGAVRYLLSPEASFVSGQVLGLSGGQL